jgi:hypothetical protein
MPTRVALVRGRPKELIGQVTGRCAVTTVPNRLVGGGGYFPARPQGPRFIVLTRQTIRRGIFLSVRKLVERVDAFTRA